MTRDYFHGNHIAWWLDSGVAIDIIEWNSTVTEPINWI